MTSFIYMLGGYKRLYCNYLEMISVLDAFVLTLNWEPAVFFCKSDVDPAD